ncbi:MAG: MgtC/SapB family protein [Clostridia bacterium]|nr:MgtC/SapB family protein [Clostridia bacterium]
MQEIIDYLRDFNIVTVAIRLVLAMICGGTIGLERGKQGRAAGMRTHILVCLGATLASMIGFYAADVLGTTGDPLRIAAQVVSGIGFLGVGTILIKGRFQITGLTTAAGLWCAGAIGLALGAGFYEGALIAFLCAVLTVTVVHRLEYTINKKYSRFGIYVAIKSDKDVSRTVDFLNKNLKISDVQITSPRSGTVGNVGIEANIHNHDFKTNPDAVALLLEAEEQVVFAIESI